MVNKNKFTIIKALNMLILFTLLNSCGVGMNGMNGRNANFYIKTMEEKIKDEQATCPNCKEGSRFLYKLATNNIILICEECNALWIDPENLGWNGATSDKKLKAKFSVKDVEELFKEDYSNWATRAEAEKSEWNGLARNNELLIK